MTAVRGAWTTVEVTGESMLPALRPGDWLLVRAAPSGAARRGSVRPGEVVVARHPRRPGLLIVKRAVRRTPAGWWLESDNQRAPAREDSWDFDAVPPDLVVGRVVARYWPPARLSLRFRRPAGDAGTGPAAPGR